MGRQKKFCAGLMAFTLSFQSVYATSLTSMLGPVKEMGDEAQISSSIGSDELNAFIKANAVTPAAVQLKEVKDERTSPALLNVEANFTALVRGGKYVTASSSSDATNLPRTKLIAKAAKNTDSDRRGYMMFGIPRDQDWDAVKSITLKVFLENRMGRDEEDTINFYITEKPGVSEENMTWENSPKIEGAKLAGELLLKGNEQSSKVNHQRWVEVDVTEAVKEYAKAEQNKNETGDISLTLCMADPSVSDQGGANFYSKYQEAGKYTPYLDISTEGYQDTLAPKVLVTGLSKEQEVVGENISFEVEVNDNHDVSPKVLINLNGTEQAGVIGANQIALKEGENTVQVKVVDAAGNETTDTYKIKCFKGSQFTAKADTYINIAEPGKNFGADKELKIKNPADETTDRRIYLNFDLKDNQQPYVREAKIYIYANKIMGNDRTYQDIEIYETSDFNEGDLTWNNAPIDQEKLIAIARMDRSSVPGNKSEEPVNEYYALDITEYINDKLINGESLESLNFALKAQPNDQTGWFIASKEEAGKAPYISLVEGLPNPGLKVEGITENEVYTSEKVEDVTIEGKSVDPSIDLTLEAQVNGKSIALVAKGNGKYDIPLDQIGKNTVQIKVTDETGNTTERSFNVTRLVQAEASTYYVDSVSGSDNGDGLSPEAAWKTLDKLNTLKLEPGTKILFKRGSVWNGQFKPNGSGTAEKPIVVASYGEGAKPILNGNGISSKDTGNVFAEATVQLEGLSYWEINDLEITNNGPVAKGDTEVRRAGILVLSAGQGELDHIYIKNCYVHDVNVDCDTSKSYKPYNGGILFVGDTRDKEGNDTKEISGFNDVLVEDCHIQNVDIEGLRLTNKLNGGDQRNDKTNDKVIFRNNLIEDIHGDGIVISGVGTEGLVEKNIIRRHSKCQATLNYAGCWVIYSDNVVFQYNEVYDGVHGYNDGEAFDFDMGAPNTIFQYNYSHNNKGGFLLTMTTAGKNNIFRYNISQNDGNGNEIFFCANKYDPAWIYNNTIYVGEGMTVPYLIEEDNLDYVYFKNNIVYVEDGGKIEKFSKVTKEYDGHVENNCFYPASILELPGTPSKIDTNITQNPMLTNPSGENIQMDTWDAAIWNENLAKFKLQADSPCINVGQNIENAGLEDIFGTKLEQDGLRDIGAHEYTVLEEKPEKPEEKPEEVVKVKEVKLSQTNLTLTKGNKKQLIATVLPENATNKAVTWISDHPEIASVDENGLVVAHEKGKAVIKVETEDGSFTASCEVNVREKEQSGGSSSTPNNKPDNKPSNKPSNKPDKNEEINNPVAPIEVPVFKDVQEKHWAYEAIYNLAKLGIVKGFEDSTFRPKEVLHVNDTFSFLDRLLTLNKFSKESSLPIETVKTYITDDTSYAYKAKLAIGANLSEETLKYIASIAEQPLSRGLVAQVLYEITNHQLAETKELVMFSDIQQSKYKEALEYCYKVGLLQGTSKVQMSPNKEITRAELMIILERLNLALQNNKKGLDVTNNN